MQRGPSLWHSLFSGDSSGVPTWLNWREISAMVPVLTLCPAMPLPPSMVPGNSQSGLQYIYYYILQYIHYYCNTYIIIYCNIYYYCNTYIIIYCSIYYYCNIYYCIHTHTYVYTHTAQVGKAGVWKLYQFTEHNFSVVSPIIPTLQRLDGFWPTLLHSKDPDTPRLG